MEEWAPLPEAWDTDTLHAFRSAISHNSRAQVCTTAAAAAFACEWRVAHLTAPLCTTQIRYMCVCVFVRVLLCGFSTFAFVGQDIVLRNACLQAGLRVLRHNVTRASITDGGLTAAALIDFLEDGSLANLPGCHMRNGR